MYKRLCKHGVAYRLRKIELHSGVKTWEGGRNGRVCNKWEDADASLCPTYPSVTLSFEPAAGLHCLHMDAEASHGHTADKLEAR